MKVAVENVPFRLRSDDETLHSTSHAKATSTTPNEAPKVSEDLEIAGKATLNQR
jgi:hypothetical protein